VMDHHPHSLLQLLWLFASWWIHSHQPRLNQQSYYKIKNYWRLGNIQHCT
jgi:hypothetical protein